MGGFILPTKLDEVSPILVSSRCTTARSQETWLPTSYLCSLQTETSTSKRVAYRLVKIFTAYARGPAVVSGIQVNSSRL